MANLRILYDNAASRAVVTGSASATGLPVSNLSNDIKSAVYRTTATSIAITLTWAVAETVNMAALCFTNLTPTATLQARCYTLSGDTAPVANVIVTAAAYGDLSLGGGVNMFAYGGGVYASIYFPQGAYQKVVLNIVDTANTAGYIEASTLLCGKYWSPEFNTEYGMTFGAVDTSKSERTEAGDLRTERGASYKTMQFDLNYMPVADRDKLHNILRGNGTYKPIYVSVSPSDAEDTSGEQIMQIYGKLSRLSAIKYQFMNQFGTQLDIEEV